MVANTLRRVAFRQTLLTRYTPVRASRPFHAASVRLAESSSTTNSDVGGTNATHTSSANADEGDIKSQRSLDSTPDEKGGSVSSPISNPSAGQSQDEEGGDPMKQDPNKSQSEKAKNTEKEGNIPLDAADK